MEKEAQGARGVVRKIVIWILSFVIFDIMTLSFAAENDRREINHSLIQARIKYDNSKYEEAIEWWNGVLALDPNNKEALKYVKRAQEKLAKIEARKSEIRSAGTAMAPEAPQPRSQEPRYLQPASTQPAYTQAASQPTFEKPNKHTFSLEDAIELGTKNHLPIQVALEQLKLSRFKEKEAFRELFPQATVRWDESSGVISNRDYTGRKYQLRMQHPLYHGGELRYTWEQARVNLRIAKENYDKTKEDYALELTKAYYDYVKALRNFAIQENLLKELEQDISTAKKERDAGVSALIDFLNAQSQYNQGYYSYLSSQNTLSLAKSNLLQLLNLDRDPTVDIRVNTELAFKEYANMDLEECIKLAYENRTDLKINELSLNAAELGERVARSQQAPKIDLTGTVGKSGEVSTPGNLQMSDEWFLGAKVSVPWGPNTANYSYTKENLAPTLTVFQPTQNEIHSVKFNILDNLASYTEAKRSEVTKQQAYSDFIKGKQTAATQVREAYFNYQESALKVKNSIASKELYDKELAVIRERRLMNEAGTQDLIAAKIKLAGEEINYNSVVVENILAVSKLNKAIGIKNYFK